MDEQIKSKYPIDAVITWVDGGDENHQMKMRPYLEDKRLPTSKNFRTRFDQVEEIKFTVDSILKFAPFIQNIYIVTDNQIPLFLKKNDHTEKYKNVFIVDHQDIFSDCTEYLPTFNSRTIETRLYKIPNLAEHFIYFNDDMFLMNMTKVEDFFFDGKPVLRGKWFRFDEDVFYKKIKNAFSKKGKTKRAGHKIAQQKGAKVIDFKKYYKFHHVPHSLRKSTFENFFKKQKEVEVENMKYKFRNFNQFIPQALAHHIEIRNKTCVLKNNYQMLYIQSYKKPLFWYQLILNVLKKHQLFLCLQSLDKCPSKKQEYLLKWLNNRFE